jgi:hypothetical protein
MPPKRQVEAADRIEANLAVAIRNYAAVQRRVDMRD